MAASYNGPAILSRVLCTHVPLPFGKSSGRLNVKVQAWKGSKRSSPPSIGCRLRIISAFSHGFESMNKSLWDEQIDRDSSEGRLDSLFAEAEGESAADTHFEWPPRT